MQSALRFSMVMACCAAASGCSSGATVPDGEGDRENVGTAPAQNQPVIEQDPRFAPTTNEAQPPATGPTAGTTPNSSDGKNDAPSPTAEAGGYKAPGTPEKAPPSVVPLKTGEVVRKAEADFKTVKGAPLDGEATLEEFAGGVRVTLKVSESTAGLRGVHVHEKGDCSDIAGKSMGEHFAPTGQKHGLPGAPERHIGDLGNIQIAQDGSGVLDITIPDATLKKDDRLSLLGRALVIHQSEDKGTGKSGDSGKPVACAVIEAD